MRRRMVVLGSIAALVVTLSACGGGSTEATVSSSAPAGGGSTADTDAPSTKPAAYTCEDVTDDTQALNARLELALDTDKVTAETEGFADAAPTLVAELIADCGRAWALEVAGNQPAGTATALKAIIDGSAPTTTTAPTTTAAPAPAPSPAPSPAPAPSPDADYGPTWFSSPSTNIACEIATGYARCDIGERYWDPPPAPADCYADWGPALSVGPGGSDFVCVGDTLLGAFDTLPYGSSAQHGSIRCDSETRGMTCTDLSTGHGFFVAREGYELF